MAERRCSFCGKAENEIAKLIAGTDANICDECVALCAWIVREDGGRARSELLAPTAHQILVRFPDGTVHTCRRESEWRPFTHDGLGLEWCVASATFERSTSPEVVVALRKRDPGRAIIGGTVPADSTLGEAEAHSIVDAFGGTSAFAEPGTPQPRREPGGKQETWPWNLVAKGFIRDHEVTNFLSQQYRVPTIALDEYEVSPDILKLVSVELCAKHIVLPISRAGNSLIVAMVDPTNDAVIQELATATGYKVEPVIAGDAAIRAAIERYYRRP